MKASEHPLGIQQVFSLGNVFIDHITPNNLQAKSIEEITCQQYISKRWHEERFARLTSSRFGEICKSRQQIALCTKMLYSKSSSISSASLLWGRDRESDARNQYAQTLGVGLSVKACGLFISTTNGYLGATPDGLVMANGDIQGCIEIKCPFSARNKSVAEACSLSSFFCKKEENGTIKLKRNHNYYYQIQGQLAVLNLPWCDFIVWTKEERVDADSKFWNQQCLPKLQAFYYNIMLPELVYPRHPLEILDYSIIP